MSDKKKQRPVPNNSLHPKECITINKHDMATFDFSNLVDAIRQVYEKCVAQASKAVNINLTLRNWVIGCYIYEYEQKGADRASYGQNLLPKLSVRLQETAAIKYHFRELGRCREFYLAYPEIGGTLPPQFVQLISSQMQGSVFSIAGDSSLKIRGTVSPEFAIPAEKLLRSLSYSHFVELMTVGDPLKRTFYEIECLRGQWSVRELKRQISSLLFERTGLSEDKNKLAEHVRLDAETTSPVLAIRDPYVFEFLGLKPCEVMGESELEDALLDKVQDFLLELGRGFCFEARQKRILIGDEFFFVDLVFYHRILKCHILIELKVDEFKHEYLGQLNTYVNWFRKNEMSDGDNLPVGLLLCTRKNHALMEYALAGMDNQLFVSRYQTELPRKEELERFIERELKEYSQEGSR